MKNIADHKVMNRVQTSKNVTKVPFIAMKISCNQFLPGWLLGHILKRKLKVSTRQEKPNQKEYDDFWRS